MVVLEVEAAGRASGSTAVGREETVVVRGEMGVTVAGEEERGELSLS